MRTVVVLQLYIESRVEERGPGEKFARTIRRKLNSREGKENVR